MNRQTDVRMDGDDLKIKAMLVALYDVQPGNGFINAYSYSLGLTGKTMFNCDIKTIKMQAYMPHTHL